MLETKSYLAFDDSFRVRFPEKTPPCKLSIEKNSRDHCIIFNFLNEKLTFRQMKDSLEKDKKFKMDCITAHDHKNCLSLTFVFKPL